MLKRGATRGDGIAGDDITANIKQIGSIPLSAKFSDYGIELIEIRGEVLYDKGKFQAIQYRPGRRRIGSISQSPKCCGRFAKNERSCCGKKKKTRSNIYII